MAIRIGGEQESLVPTAAAPIASAPVSLSEADRRKAELLAFASSIQVHDQPTFELAARVRQDVRKVRDHYETLLRPGISDAHALHKRRVTELKSYTDELDRIEHLIKSQQDRYQEEKRRLELEEKRRLEAEMAKARERILAEQFAQEVARAAAEKEAQEASGAGNGNGAGDEDGNDNTDAADAASAPSQLDSIMERMAQPAPSLPMISRPVRAEGATSRTVPTFTLLDPARVDPVWLLKMVLEEIRLKGESTWLERQIRKEVERSREGAEKIVGVGSIKFEEKISTGVRR